MHHTKAEVVGVFSSIQGEGIFLGARQIFIRFKDCNLYCTYCDEARDAASKEYTAPELISEVKFIELSNGPHHSVSVTGGEPLLYSEFLKAFLPYLRKEGLKAYLETNGTLPDELVKVIDWVDIVAMDFKLPSSTGERPFWREHSEFLKIAARKKVFVKVVVTSETTKEDVEKAVALVKKAGGRIPLVLQPVTPTKKDDKAVNKEALLRFLEIGLKNDLKNIRVIPQIHKILDVK